MLRSTNDEPEMVLMSWWVVQLLLLATIPLSAEMAWERRRSPRGWAWTAVIIGPLAPLLLAVLGDGDGAPAH
jgi:hypothetical protein